MVPGARERGWLRRSAAASALPAVALAASSLAIVARVTRVTVREELGREHVQTASSRGIPYRDRAPSRAAQRGDPDHDGRRHHDRLADRDLGGHRAAFSLNGLGATLVKAAATKDFAVVQGISLVIVGAFVIINTLVDVLYALLDPRVALGSRAS